MNSKRKIHYSERLDVRFWLGVCCILFIIFCVAPKLKASRNDLLYVITQPMRYVGQCFDRCVIYFQSHKTLAIALERLQTENETLKRALAMRKPTPKALPSFHGIPQSISTVYHYLDNGYNRHLVVQKVYPDTNKAYIALSHKGLAGRIMEESRLTCRVRLITDVQSKIAVYAPSFGLDSILVGQGHHSLKLIKFKHAQHLLNAKVGQVVYTSGICGMYPKNIPVARITAVHNDYAEAEPLDDLSRIHYVSILQYAIMSSI